MRPLLHFSQSGLGPTLVVCLLADERSQCRRQFSVGLLMVAAAKSVLALVLLSKLLRCRTFVTTLTC